MRARGRTIFIGLPSTDVVLTPGSPEEEPTASMWLLVVSCKSPRGKQDGAWVHRCAYTRTASLILL